jgi:hypothetical protein
MQEQIAAKDRELQQFQASAKKISRVGKQAWEGDVRRYPFLSVKVMV